MPRPMRLAVEAIEGTQEITFRDEGNPERAEGRISETLTGALALEWLIFSVDDGYNMAGWKEHLLYRPKVPEAWLRTTYLFRLVRALVLRTVIRQLTLPLPESRFDKRGESGMLVALWALNFLERQGFTFVRERQGALGMVDVTFEVAK